MNDLRELYQEVILDHSKNPRHFREMPEANRHADGHNPLCGDRVTVHLHLEGDVVEDVSFKGTGCSISTASASMMADALRGKKVDEVEAEWLETVPEGRFARPEEIGAAVAWLASPEAAYVRGVSLPVDGGRMRAI